MIIRISPLGLFLSVCVVASILTLWTQMMYSKMTNIVQEQQQFQPQNIRKPIRKIVRLEQEDSVHKDEIDVHQVTTPAPVVAKQDPPAPRIPEPQEPDDRPNYLKDESARAMMFHNAHYIDDYPDYQAHERNYMDNDAYFQANASLIHPYKMPVDVNGTNWINHTNVEHPILTGLRYMHSAKHRKEGNQLCHRYRFNNSLFPSMSIIVTVQNERPGLLAFTIHSLLARTPPEILKEIIIVDDNGIMDEERVNVDNDELKHLETLHPKVKIITHKQKRGCAGSRLSGARTAIGEVLMFVDSHIEMYSSTWAQHLLLPILENPRTISMQSLHVLDDRKGFNRFPVGSHNSYGVINDQFIFSYIQGKYDAAEMPTVRLPYETVFAPGSLFAIRKEEFLRLGEYDEGLIVWGAENTELALKVHMCGYDGKGPSGRIVMVPCSNVGHVYRIHTKEDQLWPPPVPEYLIEKYNLLPGNQSSDPVQRAKMAFERVIVRNNIRIMKVWLGTDHYATRKYIKGKTGKYPEQGLGIKFNHFLTELDSDPFIKKQLEFKEKNKCKSFDWFDEHVFYKYLGLHNPFHPDRYKVNDVSCGRHRAGDCGKCPQGKGANFCNGDCQWCPFGPSNVTIDSFLESYDVNGQLFFELQEHNQCIRSGIQCNPGLPESLQQKKRERNSI